MNLSIMLSTFLVFNAKNFDTSHKASILHRKPAADLESSVTMQVVLLVPEVAFPYSKWSGKLIALRSNVIIQC